MNFKKLSIILLAALLAAGGCSKSDTVTSDKAPAPTESVKPSKTPAQQITENADDDKKDEQEEVKDAAQPEKTPAPSPDNTAQTEEAPQPAPSSPQPSASPAPSPENSPAPSAKTAQEVMTQILDGVNVPRYEIMPIDSSNFSHYMFTDYIDGATGVSADALISSTAHSVCLVQLPQGVNASDFAAQVKQNADPRKWICVEAETVEVAAKDNFVLLVMSDKNTANQIVSNFKK